MRVVEVKADSKYVGRKCLCCPRKIRAGEVVLAHYLVDAPFHARDVVLHRYCVEQMLAGAPVGDCPNQTRNEREFADLRRQMLEAGTAFPARAG